jgi:hypothetical protein
MVDRRDIKRRRSEGATRERAKALARQLAADEAQRKKASVTLPDLAWMGDDKAPTRR